MNLAALIAEIAAGEYAPSRGSVGDRLLATHPYPCHGTRTLARFARAALEAEGLAWAWLLEADPDTLSESESDLVATTWKAWLDNRGRPFGRKSAGRVP